MEKTPNGFICEISEDHFKIYTLDRGLIECPKKGEEDLELGAWRVVFDVDPSVPYWEEQPFKTWEDNGEVFVHTVATTPNVFALPQEIGEKYADAVWSPYLKFVKDDEKDIFTSGCRGGLLGECIFKYAPSGDLLFEVIEFIGTVSLTECPYALAPWTLEFIGKNMKTINYPGPKHICANPYQKVHPMDVQVGVCIKINAHNPSFSDKKGSKEKVMNLFTPNWGIVRYTNANGPTETDGRLTSNSGLQRVDDPLLRLGKWFSFQTNDKRRKKKQWHENAYLSITASREVEVPDPKVTRVVDDGQGGKEVEIDTSFLFDHEMLEEPSNRDCEDWNLRHKGLSKRAHFWDFELGMVEIYPNHSQMIIEIIEEHKETLQKTNPAEFDRLKNEAITVAGAVRVHKKYLENRKHYPKQGIFVLHRVSMICYLNGGKIIYKQQ